VSAKEALVASCVQEESCYGFGVGGATWTAAHTAGPRKFVFVFVVCVPSHVPSTQPHQQPVTWTQL